MNLKYPLTGVPPHHHQAYFFTAVDLDMCKLTLYGC